MSTSNKPSIIGLTGTNGSGKDSLGIGLGQFGYYFVSVTDFLRDELQLQNKPITRENMRILSTQWRKIYGGGYLVEKAVQSWKTNQPDAKGVVMASLRDPAETQKVHEFGGVVVWLDADPKVRYQRIQDNAVLRGREGEDTVTFEQFLAGEEAELHPSADASSSLDMASVKKSSDIFVNNDHDDIDAFVRYASEKIGL